MRGEFPIIIICWIKGHVLCDCNSCEEYGMFGRICKRCDCDLGDE